MTDLDLRERRLAKGRAAIAETRRTRLATLGLRSVFFPLVEISYVVPVDADDRSTVCPSLRRPVTVSCRVSPAAGLNSSN